MSYFWSPNKKLTGRRGGGRRRRGRKWEIKPRYGYMTFAWILSKNLLRYGLLGFSWDINLVPLSRVLLGRHPNSRFKGSLIENP